MLNTIVYELGFFLKWKRERQREGVIKYEAINQVCVRGLVLWDIFKKTKTKSIVW